MARSDFLRDFLTAGLACTASTTITAPIDRVKILLQLQHSALKKQMSPTPYTGLVKTLTRIVKEQGFFALWRGNIPNALRCFPYQALNFAFKDRFQNVLVAGVAESNKVGRAIASILAGGFSGLITLTIVYPLDLVRTRLALCMEHQELRSAQSSLRHTFLTTVKNDGFFGLYKGFPFSMTGVFIYRSSFFGIYDTAKIVTPSNYQNLFTAFLEAQVAATSAGLIAYPFDTIRRNMMMQTANDLEFQNSRACLKYIYGREGLRGFYHGAGVNIIRSTGAALMLVFYDTIQQSLFGLNVFTKLSPPPTDIIHIEQMGCYVPEEQEEEKNAEEDTGSSKQMQASVIPFPPSMSQGPEIMLESNPNLNSYKIPLNHLVSDFF